MSFKESVYLTIVYTDSLYYYNRKALQNKEYMFGIEHFTLNFQQQKETSSPFRVNWFLSLHINERS